MGRMIGVDLEQPRFSEQRSLTGGVICFALVPLSYSRSMEP